ncbi:hypothetical protein H2200_008744 [Cladophialophora chaetospira]|uniref:SnoaL-like domain-containing protein n=1 Tax=Cladophialophora chaetospira TaxID=386627 RepID=A0AA38X4Q0_9EURO|nr:hypothetical protein H2200_008744 [Cladophialophora chaetospira]
MADNYSFENQSTCPTPFAELLSTFFRHADDPTSDKYLELFAPGGQLNFGPTPAIGKDAIRTARESSLNPINGPLVAQKHRLGKVFLPPNARSTERQEVIANGSVSYTLKSGRQVDCNWTSWVIFRDPGAGDWRAEFYEVYLSTSELYDAIKEMMGTAT